MTLFDNIVWHTLAGPHAPFTVGNHAVRRYAPGYPPIAAFADPAAPDLHALRQWVRPGERIYCDGWAGSAPDGWEIDAEGRMLRMVPQDSVADTAHEAVLLDARHATAALELATLTGPGPFTLKTLELGEYFGILDGERLIAMAGSRPCAGGYSEITGVCTHPDFGGKGLARQLVTKVLLHQRRRGDMPFLRAMQDNTPALCLYHRLGFRVAGTSIARVIRRH